MKRKLSFKLTTILIAFLFPATLFSQGWSPVGGGLDGTVNALGVYNGSLYAGGNFNGYLAKLDGSEWQIVGSGLNGPVSSMMAYNGKLYVSGDFTTPSELVAAWDGSQWEALDWGIDLKILEMKVYNGELYFVGDFNTMNGMNVTGIARFDGTNLKTVGEQFFYGPIFTLDEFAGNLWVGGSFPQVGSVEALNLAYWDGSSWTAVQRGSYGPVYCIAGRDFANELYFGGNFNACYGISANNIAGLEAQSDNLFALGSGLVGDPGSSHARSVIWSNSKMYVGGQFEIAGGNLSRGFAIYENGSWNDTGSDLNGNVIDLIFFNNYIYASGSFTSPVQGIGKWSEPASVEELETNRDIRLWPNPAGESVKLDLSEYDSNETLEALIMGNDGRTVGRYENIRGMELEIDISHLSPGVYVVKVCNERGEFTSGRLMISR